MRVPWRAKREIEEELHAHLRMAIEARMAGGESREEAELEARAEFGNALLVRETTRDIWGWVRLEKIARDFGYALRQLRRGPGFAAVAVFTLALGLGATSAMFSIVNSVLLEPMKYRDPQRLYSVVEIGPPSLGYWQDNARYFHEWREHCRSCEDIGLATSRPATLTGSGYPERFHALMVSYNFFRTLGVQPALGRDFRREEELPGQDGEMIVSDSLWRSRFSADPQIIGRVLRINGNQVTIIGVMPPGFQLPVGNQWGPSRLTGINSPQPDMFLPLGLDVSKAYPDGDRNYESVVRLKPGFRPQDTAAEFHDLTMEFVRRYNIGLKPVLLPLQDSVTRGARTSLWLLLGTVAAVLLIVCVNIGNLMLVRTASREREAGIRMALGSSRGELFRLVLSEALVLAAMGAGLGMALAAFALKAFLATAPIDLPRTGDVQMDARALLFAFAAAVCSVLLCGLLPAWKLSRIEPQDSLKSGSQNITMQRGKLRLRELLVSAEVALSTLLLVIGGLLLSSFYRITRVPKGFEAAHVITQDATLNGSQYTDDDRLRFADEALRQLAAIPGVQAAGMTNQVPLRGETWLCNLEDAGPPAKPGVAPANFRFVSPGYWSAMGIPLQRGRLLEATDRGRKVAVIGERVAEVLWPGQDPVGKHVGGCAGSDGLSALEVVGTVGEVRASLDKQPPFTIYQGYWDTVSGSRSFVIRTEVPPAGIMSAIRRALRNANPEVALPSATTMEQIMSSSTASRRFETELAVSFAMAALLLASLGVYGVISFTVARRTPELGIRIALGARAPEVASMILRQGMSPVLAGLACGLASALAAGRFIASQLFGVAPNDPWTIAAVSVLLLAIAGGACWVPARRAMKIDPITALRFE